MVVEFVDVPAIGVRASHGDLTWGSYHKMTTDEFLNKTWRSLRDDASPLALERWKGALIALHKCGLLSVLEVEAWANRFARCPGHDDEGGRAWCAFCGNLK
jgi:hypothetical protein